MLDGAFNIVFFSPRQNLQKPDLLAEFVIESSVPIRQVGRLGFDKLVMSVFGENCCPTGKTTSQFPKCANVGMSAGHSEKSRSVFLYRESRAFVRTLSFRSLGVVGEDPWYCITLDNAGKTVRRSLEDSRSPGDCLSGEGGKKLKNECGGRASPGR
ncbi:hypothetical protein K491DRAFT_368093 [Lophiostoma macrostomum CBS 122681]|uniref:Uncharacterized protein n=1 Tax=Lophiostoma macrostomum CBS 122681 TaxID=1314788 RepID=A0A6A6T9R8_9PLEO|nr:hypothetical protein K491DRAFT_368093 [Lophiostoma macrostomum CBS 122681]